MGRFLVNPQLELRTYTFFKHSTPLECSGLDDPFSIDIALRWSAEVSFFFVTPLARFRLQR